jgi:hypothetical protein
MNYLEALESELARAGIPRRRRARIVTEFEDHLLESPEAELGSPKDLARQFADELGTRLARATAYRAFAALSLAAVFLAVMFLTGGRTWGGWGGYGSYRISDYIPGWWVAVLGVCAVTGQVALAAGLLALIRAWRLRHLNVIAAADAQVLNRRAAVGLVCGAVTVVLLPATDLMLARPLVYRLPGGGIEAQVDRWRPLLSVPPSRPWDVAALVGGSLLIVMLLSLLPDVLRAARLRPSRPGSARDLTWDVGIDDPRVTPGLIAIALGAMIVLLLTLVGTAAAAPIDGLLRGLLDAVACMTGFVLLGRYLGLRAIADRDRTHRSPRPTTG